jgi:hypothetical protein
LTIAIDHAGVFTMSSLPPQLFQRWVHSREEDHDGLSVYRPVGYPLPPSRGRTGIEFLETGEAIFGGPGPSDRTEQVNGRWAEDESGRLRIEMPQGRFGGMTMEIISVDSDQLVVRQGT